MRPNLMTSAVLAPLLACGAQFPRVGDNDLHFLLFRKGDCIFDHSLPFRSDEQGLSTIQDSLHGFQL